MKSLTRTLRDRAPGEPGPASIPLPMGSATLMARGVALLTVALVCLPVLIDLARSPRERPFGYAAADTFYYLNVARNVARSGLPTYDGQHLVNGFHPVWQAICAIAYAASDLFGQARHVVLVVVLIDLLFVAGAVWILSRAFTGRDRALTPMFLLLPVGVYAVLVSPFWIAVYDRLPHIATLEGSLPVYGTLWSYVNGMESGPALFFFALSGLWFLKARREPSQRAAVWFGATLSLFALSRLDHVLIALPIALAFVLNRLAAHAKREAVYGMAWFLVPLGAYLLVNKLVFGGIVPISGAMKSTFPLPTGENIQGLRDMLAYGKPDFGLAVAFRIAQVFLPAITAALYLLVTVRVRVVPDGLHLQLQPSASVTEPFLVPVAVGVIALAGYNALFVPTFAQGNWYFPISTLFVTLAVIALVERIAGRLSARIAAPLAIAVLAASAVFFVKLHYHPDYHAKYASFYWRESPSVRAHYGKNVPKIIEYDDGIAAFSLDFPVTSSELVLDPAAAKARYTNKLYRFARKRGFNCITSVVYTPALALAKDKSRTAANAFAQAMIGAENLKPFDFHVDFINPSGSFAIVCGEPHKP